MCFHVAPDVGGGIWKLRLNTIYDLPKFSRKFLEAKIYIICSCIKMRKQILYLKYLFTTLTVQPSLLNINTRLREENMYIKNIKNEENFSPSFSFNAARNSYGDTYKHTSANIHEDHPRPGRERNYIYSNLA